MSDRLAEIEARLDEDDPTRPHLPGKVGCRMADVWNLKQTRDLRDLLAVAKNTRDLLACLGPVDESHEPLAEAVHHTRSALADLANLEGGAT